MDDDFNTPEGLAVLFDAVRIGNTMLDAGHDVAATAAAFQTMAEVLGLDLAGHSLADLTEAINTLAGSLEVPVAGDPEATVMALIAARATARSEQDWDTADGIRNGLADLGVVIEDSADGARWHRR